MVSWIEVIILGLVQGLTEFLPISSSAHLRVVGELLPGAADPGAAFTAITQLGTETSVLVFFWKDIVRIIVAWFGQFTGRTTRKHPDVKMGWFIIIGSLPIAILGVLLESYIDSSFRSLWLVATMLIVFGMLLAFADANAKQIRELRELNVKHGLLYGFAQALALIPGVSRSGGTITAGLLMGYSRAAAARYSFLLAIPAVFGSGLYKLAKSFGEPSGPYNLAETFVATGVGFVIAYFIIGWFLKYVSTRSYRPFVWYRIGLGALIFVLLGTGVINA